MKVEYSATNSGGSWWLDDQNWKDLEVAGWNVNWEFESEWSDSDGRFLGALAIFASREGLNLRDAINEWESVTGESSNALGCSCCGAPHSFSYEGDNGESDYYYPEYPAYGDSY